MPSVPSVAMNGMTFRRVMNRPLITPAAPPASTPSSTAMSGSTPSRMAIAVTTPLSAITEPTDRSMPAARP